MQSVKMPVRARAHPRVAEISGAGVSSCVPRNAQTIRLAFRSIGTEEPSIATKKNRAASFDHLVGKGEKCRRNSEAQGLGGFEVDDEIELGWLLHRYIAGLGAAKNFIDVVTRATE